MVAQAVFEGAIPADGVEDLLGGLEEVGTTGVLAFQSASGSGPIRLVQGQVADAETLADEERALEVLLSLRDGEFAVYPKLPHLPVSRGTDTTRRGSLGGAPAGRLDALLRERRPHRAASARASRTARDRLLRKGRAQRRQHRRRDGRRLRPGARVDRGHLSRRRRPPPRETPAAGAAGQGISGASKEPNRPSPPRGFRRGTRRLGRADATPVSGLGPRMEEGDDDATIRIIRRPGEDDLEEQPELWNTLDYSPSPPPESATTIRVKSKDDGRQIGFWRTLGWVGTVFVVVAGCLWLLASLPPLE